MSLGLHQNIIGDTVGGTFGVSSGYHIKTQRIHCRSIVKARLGTLNSSITICDIDTNANQNNYLKSVEMDAH